MTNSEKSSIRLTDQFGLTFFGLTYFGLMFFGLMFFGLTFFRLMTHSVYRTSA